jgi:hypothetical protein
MHTIMIGAWNGVEEVQQGFCLSHSVKNSSPLDRFVRPQLVSLIIHLQFSRLCFFLVLACAFRFSGKD